MAVTVEKYGNGMNQEWHSCMSVQLLLATTTPYRSDYGESVSSSPLWLGDQQYVCEEKQVNHHLQVGERNGSQKSLNWRTE